MLTQEQELEYLCDLSVISPQQMQSILAQLPAQTPLHGSVQSPMPGTVTTPVEQFNSMNLKEQYTPIPTPAPLPPPAYPTVPTIMAIASALYAYKPTDAGDLALQQNDRIQVIEHMNNDCKLATRFYSGATANFLQGGGAGMKGQDSRVFSLAVTSQSLRRPGRLCQHQCTRQITVICH